MKTRRVDLRTADRSDVRTRLTRTEELSAELARLVADLNGVPAMLDQDDPFYEVFKALPGPSGRTLANGTAGLVDKADQMLNARGLRIPLPRTSDGLQQSVTVFLNASAVLGAGLVEERVDASFDLHYSAGTRGQAQPEPRKVTVPGGLELVRQSKATTAGKRPVGWFGKPAGDGALYPRWGTSAESAQPSPTRPETRPAKEALQPTSRPSPYSLNDLTAMANLALSRYLRASSTHVEPGRAPRQNRMSPQRVQKLYDNLPEWMKDPRRSPIPAVADRIAQAHLNKGEPVLLPGAGYGFEFESTIELVIPPHIARRLGNLYNVVIGNNSAGYVSKIDTGKFFLDTEGVHYKTSEEIRRSHKKVAKTLRKPIVEFASLVFPGPDDPQTRSNHNDSVESLRALDRRLMSMADGGRHPIQMWLQDMLPERDGWRLESWAREGIIAVFHPASAIGGEMRLGVQLTAAVEITEVSYWLHHTNGITKRTGDPERLQEDGLAFGREIARVFIEYVINNASRTRIQTESVPDFAVDLLDEVEEVAAVRGFMTVTYTHVSAILVAAAGSPDNLRKNYLNFALRTSLSGGRETLTRRAREFLEKNADAIRRRLEFTFRTQYRHFDDAVLDNLRGINPTANLEDVPALLHIELPLETQEDGGDATVGDLLDNALLDTPRYVLTHDDVFGILLHFRHAEKNKYGIGRVVGESRRLIPVGISGAATYLDNLNRWLDVKDDRVRDRHERSVAGGEWRAEKLLQSARLLTDDSPRGTAFNAVRNAAARLEQLWRGVNPRQKVNARQKLLSTTDMATILVGLQTADGQSEPSKQAVTKALEAVDALRSRLDTLHRAVPNTGSRIQGALTQVSALEEALRPTVPGGAGSGGMSSLTSAMGRLKTSDVRPLPALPPASSTSSWRAAPSTIPSGGIYSQPVVPAQRPTHSQPAYRTTYLTGPTPSTGPSSRPPIMHQVVPYPGGRALGSASPYAPQSGSSSVQRAVPGGHLSFEDDLVAWVQRVRGRVTKDEVLAVWKRLVVMRGVDALPTNVVGRAEAVAQALGLPPERWDEVFRTFGGSGNREPEHLQTPGASGSGRTLEFDRPSAGGQRTPHQTGGDHSGVSAPAVAVVNMAWRYVDRLRWRGGSVPSPRDGWQISETIGDGNHVNDFARWIRGTGARPNRDSTMAPHEAIFFAAYRAGVVDSTWLRRVYAQAAKRANSVYRHFLRSRPGANFISLPNVGDRYGHDQMTRPEVVFQSTLTDYLAPGPRDRYEINPSTGVGTRDIPAGHVILFDGINGHVALSLGSRDNRGRQQVLSLWCDPQNIPLSPEERRPTGSLQSTTVEDIVFSGHGNNRRFRNIEFAAPPWVSGSDGVPWLSSSRSKRDCVNVAVVWMCGDRTLDRSA